MTKAAQNFFPIEDEYGHEIGSDPSWQESVVLTWWDHARGVGGFHRIGHEPGRGSATSWVGIATLEGLRFRQHRNVPLRAGDHGTNVFRCSDAYEMRFEGKAIWTIREDDCRMTLEAEDYTPRFDLFRGGGTVTDDFAPGHLEAAGPVRGRLRLGERSYEVDGLGYRDHSWGRRDWNSLLSHRWIAGTCGPELTFNAASWHGRDGTLRTFGIVVRNGEVTYAEGVDILVAMEIDATTHRGGVLKLTLPSAEEIVLEPKPVDGFVTLHNGIACVDELCLFEYRGKQGFCDFEISTNPRGGSEPITALVGATMETGLSWRGKR